MGIRCGRGRRAAGRRRARHRDRPLLRRLHRPGDDDLAAFQDRLAPAYVHRVDAAVLRGAMAGTIFRADAMRRGFEVLTGWSVVDRLGDVTAPVLLLAGRHDAFCAWPQSTRIARAVTDAETVIFEHSGHVPWLDEPERFFGTVIEWLGRRALV